MMCEHHTTVQGLLHHTLQASYSIDVQLVPLGQDVPTQSTMCISISIQEREGDTHVRRRMRRRKRKRRRIMSSGRTPLRMEICTQYALQSNAVLRGRRRIIRSTSRCDKITRLCSCVLFGSSRILPCRLRESRIIECVFSVNRCNRIFS